MVEVEIGALELNALAVVAQVIAGEHVIITVRGRPVAQILPIAASPLQQMIDTGRARRPVLSIAELPSPEPGPDLSRALAAQRAAER